MNSLIYAATVWGKAFTIDLLTKSLLAWLGIFGVTAVIVAAMYLLGIFTKGKKK